VSGFCSFDRLVLIRCPDRGDLPEYKTIYALRDVASLIGICVGRGRNNVIQVERRRDDPLPWRQIRSAD
jgi:hypothetical protein